MVNLYYTTTMFGLGVQELVIILVIILVLFGGKNLPELSKSISDSIKQIRKGFSDTTDESPKNNHLKKKA